MVIAFLSLTSSTACFSIDLAERPCPCLDGFVCVNDVCIDADDVDERDAGPDDDADAGEGGDDDDAGEPDVPDAGEPPVPECENDDGCSGDDDNAPICRDDGVCVECLNDDDCGIGLLCDEGNGTCFTDGSTTCFGPFDTDDACAVIERTDVELTDVCGDERTVTTELMFRVGQLGSSCILPDEFEHVLVDADLNGAATITESSINVDVTGTLTFDVRIPPACLNKGLGCGDDECSVNDDDGFCECTFVVDGTRSMSTENGNFNDSGVFFGEQGEVATCSFFDALMVREVADGFGFFGPVYFFEDF